MIGFVICMDPFLISFKRCRLWGHRGGQVVFWGYMALRCFQCNQGFVLPFDAIILSERVMFGDFVKEPRMQRRRFVEQGARPLVPAKTKRPRDVPLVRMFEPLQLPAIWARRALDTE